MRTRLIAVVCSLCALGLTADATVQPCGPVCADFSPFLETVTVLPRLGGLRAEATAISEAGHVVGLAATEAEVTHAFLWTRAGGLRELVGGVRPSEAHGVNDRGEVVGWFENEYGVQRAFMWSERKGLVELPAPVASTSTARFITNAHRILGTIDGEDVIWEPDGTARPVAAIVGAPIGDVTMNEFGDFVGQIWPGGYVKWTPQSGFTPLNIAAYTTGINDAGDVVAVGQLGSDVSVQPFLWTSSGVQPMLSPGLLTGDDFAGPINNVGQVLGWGRTDVPGWLSRGLCCMTFVWSRTTGVVPLWGSTGEDGQVGANGINDQATVVGNILVVDAQGYHFAPVVAQLRTTPLQLTGAMRVRITQAARHDVLARGHARALVAKLDQIDRALRAGTSAAPHARALQKQILAFTRTGALRDAYALPLEILTRKLIDTIRSR